MGLIEICTKFLEHHTENTPIVEIIEILFESPSKFVMQHAEELPGVEHE